jgi:drug/metabolite transporter (DMT)-like permease
MEQSPRTRRVRVLTAAALVATLVLTAAAEGPGLADPALLGVILALVAVAVAALVLVRRRRRGRATPTNPTEGE